MRCVWERRLKQPKVRRKSQRAPLVISEMHRSRLVLKYVLLFYFIDDSTYTTDTQNQIHSGEMILESDASEEDSSSDAHSDHDEEAADLDDERGATPVEMERDTGREVQGSEYGGE